MTTMTNTSAAVLNDHDNNNKIELLLERKIASVTDGLQQQFVKKLRHLVNQEAL
jgi:hypothetical protein